MDAKAEILFNNTPDRAVEIQEDKFYFIYHQLSQKSHMGYQTIIPKGSYIDIELLTREMEELELELNRNGLNENLSASLKVFCDPEVVVILPFDVMLDRAFEEAKIAKDCAGVNSAMGRSVNQQIVIKDLYNLSSERQMYNYFSDFRMFYERKLSDQITEESARDFWLEQINDEELLVYYSEQIYRGIHEFISLEI